MKTLKYICPFCDSYLTIQNNKDRKNMYHCYNCSKNFSIIKYSIKPVYKDILILDSDSNLIIKKEIFNFLKKYYQKFSEDANNRILIFLDAACIKIDIDKKLTYKNIFDFLNETTYDDCHCHNPGCNNETKFYGFKSLKLYPRGYYLFCSQKCFHKYFAIKQKGEGNTFHRITDENMQKMKTKLSEYMKDKIKKGEFKPNIFNSWRNTKIKLKINNEIREFRSSWEAFFNLVNPHLEYEKILIPYVHNDKEHTYIIDFVDFKNKILYEIKPFSQHNRKSVISKLEYAKKWCIENDYDLKIINDDWFYDNYKKYIHLLNNQDEDGERILRNMRRFKYENKKDNKN